MSSPSSACSAIHSTAPGSSAPERVAITRPSSGVKPIVVITLRPSTHRGERGAAAEVRHHEPAHAGREGIHATGRPGVRDAVEPVDHDALAPNAPGARRCARRGTVVWNAVSKQANCGTSGHAARHRSISSRGGGWCNGASVDQRGSSATSSSSRSAGAVRAAVHDAVEHHVEVLARASAASSVSKVSVAGGSSNDTLSEVEPALTTSARTDQPVQDQSTTSAMSSPCSRVHSRRGAGRRPGPWRSGGRACPEPGDAVDHVDGEAVAIEVVQHDHVERRGRRAVLLEARARAGRRGCGAGR